MALINGIYITVETEDPSYEIDMTEQPVEKGANIADHVQPKAKGMSISGLIVGDDAAQTREALIGLMNAGSIVQYDGRNFFVGLIQSLSTKHDYTVANGYTFSMTLREIKIAESSYVDELPAPVRAAAAPVISSGTKQKKKSTKGSEKEVEKVTFKAGSPWAT